jgi:RimJ/RimL family protein N-acetyltransferase
MTTTVAIPTLQTPRLTLRPMRADDFPAYAAEVASDRTKWMGGPYDLKGAWGMFCHDLVGWDLFGMGSLMIDRRDTGETVGQVQINNGPVFPETELGWLLYADHEGRGYATEAAACLRDWAFGERGLATLVSYVDPENIPSARVAERLGGVPDPDAPRMAGEDGDIVFRYVLAAGGRA